MIPTPVSPSPDAPDDLFARRSGDQAAWSELFHKCQPKVLRVVRRRLSPPMRTLYDSSDFVSDALKSLAASADRLDFQTFDALVAFLVQVAEQKVIDEYRRVTAMKRNITRQRPLSPGDEEGGRALGISSGAPTASQFAVATEAGERLRAGKSEVEREAIALKYDGHTPAEIAERLGWSLRTVQRFFKNLRDSFHLRDSLQNSGGLR